MKRYWNLPILFILAISIVLLSGCGKKKDDAVNLPAGYVASGSLLTGGEEVADSNARTLTVETVSNEMETTTNIIFDFVTGSQISEGTEEHGNCGVPSYTAYVLPSPHRLVVEFPLLRYWDYTHDLSIDDPLIQTIFLENIAGDPTVRIYFQLNQPVLLSAKAEGDRLTLTLLPKEIQAGPEAHFVTVNAYSAYCAGEISPDLDLHPTLASDHSNKVLISPPLEDEDAAQSFLMTGQLLCPHIPKTQWEICTLADGTLPEYNLASAHAQAYETPAIQYQGIAQTLPVLSPNSLFLCDMPDGGYLLSRELETMAPAGEEETTNAYQQIWALDPNGDTRLLTPFEFAGIEQAAFSPDGRKLAILERAQGGTHLYIFDADTWELLNDLSETGFGSNTSAFAWNSLGNIVYAITGTSGMQLHQFDYSIPDETQRHSIIDRNSIDEGGLGLFDGELYFCTSTMEEGSWIYRIKPEGGVRKPYLPGSAFALSSDNRYMAILQSSETNTNYQLQLLDLTTENARAITITDQIFPYDMIWSQDCKTLYYIENQMTESQSEVTTSEVTDSIGDPSAETDGAASQETNAETSENAAAMPYPYTLWAYDVASGTSEAIVDLSAPDLFSASEPGVLYLNRYEEDQAGARFRACYRLDLNVLTQPPAEESETGEKPA